MRLTQGRGVWSGSAWPSSTGELEVPARLVLWASRRWFAGLRQNAGFHWSMVWDEFAGRMGARDGRVAMSAFVGLMRHLQQFGRRRMPPLQPCCAGLAGDEICLLRLVCACQGQDLALADRLALWLVRGEGVSAVTAAASDFAAALDRNGLPLPRIEPVRGPDAVLQPGHRKPALATA